MLKKKIPCISSAINKTEYFINQANEIHGNKYDYSKSIFEKFNKKVKIICKIHGEFLQSPNSHLSGCGCNKCSTISTKIKNKLSTEKFINKASIKHNNFFSYQNAQYISCYSPVIVTCPIHGDFKINAYVHLHGQGCKKCGYLRTSILRKQDLNGWSYTIWEKKGLKSKRFDSFKVYIIECWDNNEKFYKIGKTFLKLKDRFPSKTVISYNFKAIKIFEGNSREISKLENDLKIKNKNYSYIPLKTFGGISECFLNYVL